MSQKWVAPPGASDSASASSSRPRPRPCRSGATIRRPTSHRVASSGCVRAAHRRDEAARRAVGGSHASDIRRPLPQPGHDVVELLRQRWARPNGPARQGLRAPSRRAAARAARRHPQGSRPARRGRPAPPSWRTPGSRSGRRAAVRSRRCACRQRGDRAVVAGEQHRRHVARRAGVVPGGRAGVDGVLEQAVLVRLLDERLGVADHTGQQAPDGLDHGEHGHLAAVEDVVTERDDRHRHPGCGVLVDALVDALVAAAGERQPRLVGERRARAPG